VVAVYLLDSCILLEYLLDQDKADEVEKLLLSASETPMAVTEFSLYSIGINMLRQKLADRFIEFVDDALGVCRRTHHNRASSRRFWSGKELAGVVSGSSAANC